VFAKGDTVLRLVPNIKLCIDQKSAQEINTPFLLPLRRSIACGFLFRIAALAFFCRRALRFVAPDAVRRVPRELPDVA
jgi:hypothetical protein